MWYMIKYPGETALFFIHGPVVVRSQWRYQFHSLGRIVVGTHTDPRAIAVDENGAQAYTRNTVLEPV